jgi:ketosteroid isomerase-like protein
MSEENVALYRRVIGAYNAGDLDALLALLDPGVKFVARTSGVEGAGTGHDGVRSWWDDNRGAFEDLHIELDRVVDGGNWVVAAGISHIKGGQSGVALDVPFAQAVEYREDKVVRFESFHTLAEALKAAGLSE